MSAASGPGGMRAWLELARASNLPTVVSNVVAGAAVGVGSASLPWSRVGLATAAISALYVAGMILNDVADADADARQRPQRPIPSGRVTRRGAAVAGGVLLALGVGLLLPAGVRAATTGAVLAACIVAYDWLHRERPWTVGLMGACRGLVYWVAATAAVPRWPVGPVVLLSAAVTLYTVLLTFLARRETAPGPGRRRGLALLMPPLALSPVLVIEPRSQAAALIAAAVVVGWLGEAARRVLGRAPRIRSAVLLWISGFCLIDAYVVVLLGRWELAAVIAICWVLTCLGHTRIAGT